MGFLSSFFKSAEAQSAALIDLDAYSVGGAYAHYAPSETPRLLYAARVAVRPHSDEPHEEAALRALSELGQRMVLEGAPALARATGKGSAEHILVSIGAPWQETVKHTHQFEERRPFAFTRELVRNALEDFRELREGKLLADESVIGTTVNGYDARDPYGQEVYRASVTVLSSHLHESIGEKALSYLKSLYHTADISRIAGSSLRYQAMRKAFPHERDAVILDLKGPAFSLGLVRGNACASLIEGSEKAAAREALAALAREYPLPRTVFLLTDDAATAPELGDLWPKEQRPKIIPVLASHVVGQVRHETPADPDLPLLLMTLFAEDRAREASLPA